MFTYKFNVFIFMFRFLCVFQMYEMFGNKIYMSMSADTTCRGLRSSKDGPLVMSFTRGELQIRSQTPMLNIVF